MASWFGFSGSPMFLPNGHVVALNNSGGTFSQNGLSQSLAWGIRADCLWELLKANGLLDKVNVPPEAASVDIERFSKPDPELEKLQKVNKLLAAAQDDVRFSRLEAAIAKCNDAAQQLPDYATIYGLRGSVYLDYASHNLKPTDPQTRKYNQMALEDENRALQLDPVNTNYYLEVAMANCNLTNISAPLGKRVPVPSSIELADRMINNPSTSLHDKVFAYRVALMPWASVPILSHISRKPTRSFPPIIPSTGPCPSITPTTTIRRNLLVTSSLAKHSKAHWPKAKPPGNSPPAKTTHSATPNAPSSWLPKLAKAPITKRITLWPLSPELMPSPATSPTPSSINKKRIQIAPEHKRAPYTDYLAAYQVHKPCAHPVISKVPSQNTFFSHRFASVPHSSFPIPHSPFPIPHSAFRIPHSPLAFSVTYTCQAIPRPHFVTKH